MTLETYCDYFRDLARRLFGADNRFATASLEEALAGLRRGLDLTRPCLILEPFSGTIDGQEGQFSDNQTCAFLVVCQVRPDDFAAEIAALSETLRLGRALLARVKYDSEAKHYGRPLIDWLTYFQSTSVAYDQIPEPIMDNCFGYRFVFDIFQTNALAYDPTLWNDV